MSGLLQSASSRKCSHVTFRNDVHLPNQKARLQADKPGSVLAEASSCHLSGTTVADGLYQPTRRHRAGRPDNAGLFGLSAREVYPGPWLPTARTDS